MVVHAEFKLQVLANLANFAYDPINYEHFRQLNILDLFLDVIAEESDEKMIEYAMGGICNCCLDEVNMHYLIENDGVELTIKCLSSANEETVLSAITTLMCITTPETKKGDTHTHTHTQHHYLFFFVDTTADNIIELMKKFAESSNKRLSNLANVFLQDHCKPSVGAPVPKPSVGGPVMGGAKPSVGGASRNTDVLQ